MNNRNFKFGEYDYEIIKSGVFNLQVCSNCPPKNIKECEEAVRLFSPAGTANNWFVEKKGKLKPVKCADSKKRWHYVFSC